MSPNTFSLAAILFLLMGTGTGNVEARSHSHFHTSSTGSLSSSITAQISPTIESTTSTSAIATATISSSASVSTNTGTTANSNNNSYTSLSDTAYTSLHNPSRGFINQVDIYLSQSSSFLNTSTLQDSLNQDRVLQQLMIYLDTHLDGSAITVDELTSIENMFKNMRSAGMKAVVRFAYTDLESGTTDVNLADMQGHIEQLGSIIQDYADIVYIIQLGLIGTWGEWYYTSNFGTEGTISTSDQTNRNTITQKLLDILPSNSFAQMRTPAYKQSFIGSTDVSVDSSTKFTDASGAKIGHFDDCVFGSDTDEGTYRDTTLSGADHVYVQTESLYTPRGGETCGESTSTSLYSCSAALNQLAMEHWQFLNIWYETMLDAWTSEGCYDEMIGRLGYRLELSSASFDSSTSSWDNLEVTNTGFGSIMQPYDLQVIYLPSTLLDVTTPSGTYTGYVGSLSSVDVRDWSSNSTSTIGATTFCTSATTTGPFEVFLAINDASSIISTVPSFRIVFSTEEAQSGPSWVVSTRINRLMQTVDSISSSSSCDVVLEEKTLEFIDGVLTGF